MTHLLRVGQIARVAVSIHWTLIAAIVLVLAVSIDRLVVTLVALTGYVASMLIHEWGHVLVARRRGCHVFGIELYAIYGVTRFTLPATRLDHCAIAWGGVLLQAAIGFPLVAWIKLVGYTPIEILNAIMAFVGFLSVVMVILNLMPMPPLDGAVAWSIVPLLFSRARRRVASRARPSGWRR